MPFNPRPGAQGPGPTMPQGPAPGGPPSQQPQPSEGGSEHHGHRPNHEGKHREQHSPAEAVTLRVNDEKHLSFEDPIKNTSFSSNKTTVEILPFTGTPKTITLAGRAVGTASVTLLFTDGTKEELAVSVAE
jgi:hypothetical protein